MDNKMTSGPSSKKIWVLLGLVAVIIVITVIAATSRTAKTPKQPAGQTSVPNTTNPASPTGDVTTGKTQVELAQESVAVLKDARQEVPGSVNLVTKDNKVVNLQGQIVKNDASPTSPEAPQQTGPLNKESLSTKVIKLDFSLDKGIVPREFTVAKGAPVSIAVSSLDQWSHIFRFTDPSLSAVAIGVSAGETRSMTFNAPTKAGEYTFSCDYHANRGEVGKMIVK